MKRDSNRNYNSKANSYITEFVGGKNVEANRKSGELDMVEMGTRDQSTGALQGVDRSIGAFSHQVNTSNSALARSHRDQPRVPPIPNDVYARAAKNNVNRTTSAFNFSTDPNAGAITVQ